MRRDVGDGAFGWTTRCFIQTVDSQTVKTRGGFRESPSLPLSQAKSFPAPYPPTRPASGGLRPVCAEMFRRRSSLARGLAKRDPLQALMELLQVRRCC